MPTLHLLGTGAAVSSPDRTVTMLAVEDGPEVHVVDCGGDVVQRMLQAGLFADDLRALYLTHAHPDHIAGFPLFLEKVWLMGRRAPIPIYGPADASMQRGASFRCLIRQAGTAYRNVSGIRSQWSPTPQC